MQVAVSPRSFRQVPGRHHQALTIAGLEARYPSVERHLDEEEMVELVKGCEGLIVGIDPVTDRVMEAGPLKAIAKYGSGLDNIDLEAAERRGVPVRSTPGANSQGVAELTLALLFAIARHVVFHHESAKDGRWERRIGVELAGRRLGLVGLGEVGSRVATMARGIGMEVIGYDPFFSEAPVDLTGFEDVLETSWAVSLHVPLTKETRGLLGRDELAKMPSGAVLVNTARAGLVDEEAVARALTSGHLGGAAFDDLEERPPPGSPLWNHDTFIVSPHAGASTFEAVERTGLAAIEALVHELDPQREEEE